MTTKNNNKKKSIEDLLKTLENDERFLELLSCDDIQGVQEMLSQAISQLEGGDIIAKVKVLKMDQEDNSLGFDVIDEALQRIGDVDLSKIQKRTIDTNVVIKKEIRSNSKTAKLTLSEIIEQVLETETTQEEDNELGAGNAITNDIKGKLIGELLQCNRHFDNPLDIRVMYESEQFCMMNIAGQPLNGHIATVLARHLSNKQLQKEYQLRPNDVLQSLIEQEGMYLTSQEKQEQERHLSLYYGIEILDKKNKNTLFLEQNIAKEITEKLWTILSSQDIHEQDFEPSFDESDDFLSLYMNQLGRPLKIQ